ncbi:phospholipase D family protein [Candidatus Pristimantibacillus sp. PTI5]|uniref:phospholipase D family protein n=1 Tax=Candidatus Pristimantibacillus sp. PTI5 TaxID=3400422 RepID=UPI003B01C275
MNQTNPESAPISPTLVVRPKKNYKKNKNLWLIAFLLFVVFYACVAAYHSEKPLPEGISMEGPVHYVTEQDIEFLYDLTSHGSSEGQIKTEQMIFNSVYKAIEEATEFIVIDMFLYNSLYDKEQSFPSLSRNLTDRLIAKKMKYPQMDIVFITDEINSSYGSHPASELERLHAAGIYTHITDVNPLRDSNPLYSAGWRIFAQWFGEAGEGWLTNKMATAAPDMTLRSYMKLLNIKANHRKVIVTDKSLIVSTANPHDASYYSSNSGFKVNGNIIGDALASEQAAVGLSDSFKLPAYSKAAQEKGDIRVRLLTEGKILKHVSQDLSKTESGDLIWIGMFYLADRQVIEELLKASERGVEIRLILDPNQNAFGSEKIGIPNRPVASELINKSNDRIQIRWYNTEKEQFHTKLMLIRHKGDVVIHNGSGNYTTRNLDDLNLETNLKVEASENSRVSKQVQQYFEKLWENEGAEYTLDYSAYQEETVFLKRILYRVQGLLDFTTF